MSKLHISEGKNTPEVNWDVESGTFSIMGKSFPENSKKFYNPLTDWLDEQEFAGVIKFEFYFYYLSSSSIIAIYQILKRLESISDKGTSIEVIWKYDDGDDDIERIGLDYQKITSLNIAPVMVEED
jgi:hypothetical protein